MFKDECEKWEVQKWSDVINDSHVAFYFTINRMLVSLCHSYAMAASTAAITSI